MDANFKGHYCKYFFVINQKKPRHRKRLFWKI